VGRVILFSALFLISGIFSEEDNACRRNYVFCPGCKVGSILTPSATPTPDDNGLVTRTHTPTVTSTVATTTVTATPTATVGQDGENSLPENEVMQIFKEIKALPTPVPSLPGKLSNWIGNQVEEKFIDSDVDGFADWVEERYQTSPSDPNSFPSGITKTLLSSRVKGKDSDFDGALDAEELAIGSNPYVRDSDQDGCIDGLEIMFGSDSLVPNSKPANDSDGDCIPDDEERAKTTNLTSKDTDSDGLSDGDEIAIGTDPFHPDTDRDGISDAREVSLGSDPMIPEWN
jgi:hypothetical protein